MSNYIRDKLSLKLNLHLSEGKKTEGVVSDRVIDKMLKDFTGYGHYEIIWDNKRLLPIALSRLRDNLNVKFSGSQYILLHEGRFERVLFPTQYIEFDIAEYRNKRLNEILK